MITGDEVSVQVGNKIFLITDKDAPIPKMICISNLEIRGYNSIITTKTAPPNQRGFPSIANFNDECIFFGGGVDSTNDYLTSVDFYMIESNTWSSAPDMIQARSGFSFCAQGEKLYAMFGKNPGGITNTIESLNVRKLLYGDQANWCTFSLALGYIHDRLEALVAPISRNQIAILGGKSYDNYDLSEVIILNTQTREA